MEWLTPIVSAVLTVLGLLFSKPERRTIAVITVISILGWGGWQAYQEHSKARIPEELRRTAVGQLSRQFRGFLEVISEGLVRGTDGWLPQTDADLIRAISAVEEDVLLKIGQLRRQRRSSLQELNLSDPPILCWGMEVIVGDSLAKLGTLYKQVSAAEKAVNIEQPRYWLEFPPHYVARYCSADRFSPADFDQWIANHPGHPGPPLFGKGDPRKTPQLDPRLRRQ